MAARLRGALAGTEERRKRTVVAASALLVLGAAMSTLSPALFAELRVVNASGAPLFLAIDGGVRVRVTSVAAETPGAGVTFRLFAGRHALSVTTDDGTRVDARTERLTGGEAYLYAAGASEQCFWVQHDAYGEARAELPLLAPLENGPFFHLPRAIDAWFFPNPAPSSVDKTSSGGTRTALRMARCGLPPWR